MISRRICVVTGSRAEYGLLRPLLRQIGATPGLTLKLLVTGSHLSPIHGLTVSEIEGDGFTINKRVGMLEESDSRLAIARSLATGTAGMAEALADLAPDLVVLLGDRYEILAAAQAALILGLPIAHLYGGELTEGAWDDQLRHAITKMAHLHFVAAEPYRRRVIQMGEDPSRVFTTGTVAVDTALTFEPLSDEQLTADLGGALRDPCLLVTFHPVTCGHGSTDAAVRALLEALDTVPGARIVITGANADAGGARIMEMLRAYAAERPERVTLHASLGQRRYLSVMRHAAAVVGNSSSALIEAPALGIPSINIGDRQRGRLKATSVIDCGEGREEITAALAKALDPNFRARLAGQPLPYGGGHVAERMVEILRSVDLRTLRSKQFYDLPELHPC